MIAFWALVAVGIFWLVKTLAQNRAAVTTGRESALEILDRRFAAGEIDSEEYERRRAVLERQAR